MGGVDIPQGVSDAERQAKEDVYEYFLTEPNETLQDLIDPLERIQRSDTFVRLTGLDGVNMINTPLLTIPIPRYYSQGYGEGGGRRWAGLNPAAMWHPLMWLPKNITERYAHAANLIDPTLSDDDETEVIESDDLWATRMAMELTVNGFYDAATGLWRDILDMHGLDRYQPETLQRVERWLDGQPDEVLDSIDLSRYFEHDDDSLSDWAHVLSVGSYVGNQEVVFELGAKFVATHVTGIIDAREGEDEVEWGGFAATQVSGLCVISHFYFGRFQDSAGVVMRERLKDWLLRAEQLQEESSQGVNVAPGAYALLVELGDAARVVEASVS